MRTAVRFGAVRGETQRALFLRIDLDVRALDVVEIDPTKDVHDLTARSGCSVILTFLAGLYRRIYGDRGY